MSGFFNKVAKLEKKERRRVGRTFCWKNKKIVEKPDTPDMPDMKPYGVRV
jgi:hypothetical protein